MTGSSSLAAYLRQAAAVIESTINSEAVVATEQAIVVISQALHANKPLLVCGNGGSASDACHIAGEMVGRFLKERRALRCVSLVGDPAVMTALANDYGYEQVFARQVEALGEKGGVLLAISTSGNSPNVLAACQKARDMGMQVIGLTGHGGGKMAAMSDILIAVPSRATPEIQQVHLCLYHYLCQEVEMRITAMI
ncbi:MAG: SIS domain-containing protein [Alphaproteobacteria bacterium]|nr:MAG: SIS domain-containing protein [Alphaproteobacteria bacterium]